MTPASARLSDSGPLDLVFGLPAHPLIVHVAVVLLPLAAAALIAIVLVRGWRRPFGWVVMAGLAIGAGGSLLAKESGEALAARVGLPEDHANLGNLLPPVAFALLAAAALWFWLMKREESAGRDRTGAITRLVATVACALAVAAIGLTVVVGHSGAVAVWQGRVTSSNGQAAPASSAASPSMSASAAGSDATAGITMEQVAAHASASDCWSVVQGTVYDLTTWISQHPGGAGPIESMCGVDATDAFMAQHGSAKTPNKVLAGFALGPLTQ